MDTVIAPPIQASPADRAKARNAVSDYLRHFGLTEPAHIERLTERFMAEAEAAGEPASAPLYAEQAVAAWFAAILGSRLTRPDLAEPIGRAAFLIANGAKHWPEAFLADEAAPSDLVAALRRTMPVPAPDPMPAAMVAQALEVPALLPSFFRPVPRVERSSL
ncbi:MAG TPA: hypothetical protein VFO41_02315 [Alphaproteobacteria bacterium]|nr:hypothetical protein [Alphaproteobacteria bacterium]